MRVQPTVMRTAYCVIVAILTQVIKCVWLIWVKAIWYDHIYFGVILQWLKLKLKLKQLTKNTGHDYVYVADVQCQVMVALVTLYGFMCNIALVTFLGLQYWSAPVINIYEHRKTCIFCVVSLVKLTKVSWNCLEIFQKFGPEISLLAARSPAFTGYCMHFSLWLHQGPQTSPDM